jgi:hypothetical protein
MDLIGTLAKIMNKGPAGAETFDNTTDSLEAIRDFIAGAVGDIQGGFYYGTVTAVPGANQFTIAGLAGYGETAFVGWDAYVFWDVGGAGAAPQHETQAVTVYTNLGVFTTAAYTAAVGIGDIMILIHPNLADRINELAVPAADAVTNTLERDVIGNKTDTNAGTSLLARQLVQTADAVTNTNSRDVVGNKTSTAIYTKTATADQMRYLKGLMDAGIAIGGAVADAGAAVTDFDTNLTEATDNHYNGMLLMFVDGVDAGQTHTIDDYVGGTKNVAFHANDWFTDAPANGDHFVILPFSVLRIMTGLITFDIFHEQNDTAINTTAINAGETDIINFAVVANHHYMVRHLRLKCADPGANTVTVRLYELINDVLTQVDSFDITTANFANYFSLMDMFGLQYLAADAVQITVRASAGGPYTVTGQYSQATTG